jgi:hypothetical protein
MGKWIDRRAASLAAVLAGWMLLAAAPGRGGTPGQVSWTAEGVAALRAIAAQDPDPKIRCPDHLAEKFVTADFWRYSPYAPDYKTTMKVVRAYRFYDSMPEATFFELDLPGNSALKQEMVRAVSESCRIEGAGKLSLSRNHGSERHNG